MTKGDEGVLAVNISDAELLRRESEMIFVGLLFTFRAISHLTVFLLSRNTFLIGIWEVELLLTKEARSARLWVTREGISRYINCSTKFTRNDVRRSYFT